MENTESELLRMCTSIAEEISNGELDPEEYGTYHELDEEDRKDWKPSGHDYLECVYDIKYVVDGQGNYYGAELLVAGGGPNIYVNTRDKEIQGYWGGDRASVPFTDNIGLDDAVEEHWNCIR